MNVGIGGNGTVNSVTNAPMGLLSLANIVEQKGKDEYPGFSQYHGGAISIARRKGIDVGRKGKKRKRDTLDRDRSKDQPMCGLCGKTANLTKTECCDNWICDDEEQYILFSYARNSCHRNHRRFTLCGYHHAEEHTGNWKDCPQCEKDIETEMYVYYGTNEYNFEKLENPPDYQPTKCAKCGSVIVLGEPGYSTKGDQYFCAGCSIAEFPELFRRTDQ